MQKIPSVLSVALRHLLSVRSIFWIGFTALLYLTVMLFLLNYRLVFDTISAHFPLQDKLIIIFSLFGGLFTAFSPIDAWISIVSALLVGINIVLLFQTMYAMEHTGKIKLSIGGATLIGIAVTGCSSCGFSLLSLIGLGTSFSFLPFHGLSIHILSVVLLFFSAWYLVKKLRDGLYCKTT